MYIANVSTWSSSLSYNVDGIDESRYEAGSVNDTPAYSLDGRALSCNYHTMAVGFVDALALKRDRDKRGREASDSLKKRRRMRTEDVRIT